MMTTTTKPKTLSFTPDCAGLQSVLDGEYAIALNRAPVTVLDIGANQGAFTAWARAQWPAASIMAFEPVPENIEKFLLNHGEDAEVRLFKGAVWNLRKRGKMEMHYGKNNLGECSRHDIGEQQISKTITVSTYPADGIGACEFIKIDTEGCEVEILEGGLHLSQALALACEYHREDDITRINSVCEKAGLDLVAHIPRCENRGILKFRRPGCEPAKVQLDLNDRITEKGDQPSRRVKLFIGLPVYQKIDVQFMQCLSAMQKEKNIEVELHYKQGDGIARSRNILTHTFLKSDCTHLLMLDCDLIFSWDQIERLISHGKPVIAGFYPKKQEGRLEWVVNTLPENPAPDANGLQRVKYGGTGFLLIAREVFTALAKALPESAYREDYGAREMSFDYWPMAPYGPESAAGRLQRARELCKSQPNEKFSQLLNEILNGSNAEPSRYLSEDWFFCQRWLDMGGEIFADTWVILRHIGTVIYPLQTQLPEINAPVPRK